MRLINCLSNLSNTDDSASTTDLDSESAHKILSSARRRRVVEVLSEEPIGAVVNVGDLASEIAEEDGSQARKKSYISLHQQHLPAMEKYGVIEYRERDKTMVLLPEFTMLYCAQKQMRELLG